MAKFVVCPECEGEGYLGTLGAFTADELYESYGDDYIVEYIANHEASKTACAFCNGHRVITQDQMADHADWQEYEAEKAAESRFSGGY